MDKRDSVPGGMALLAAAEFLSPDTRRVVGIFD